MIYEQFYKDGLLSDKQWSVVKKIRRLASQAFLSQDISINLQSHIRFLSMPKGCMRDTHENDKAEHAWKKLMQDSDPYVQHGLLDKAFIWNIIEQKMPRYPLAQIQNMLDLLSFLLRKCRRRHF